jgi:PEP-CTERM motif
MKRISAAAGITFFVICSQSAWAQITLESLSVAPPAPTTADSVIASVGGMVNVWDTTNFRTEWKREGTDIFVDVLDDFVPAPPEFVPQMVPYTEQAALGNLPAGTYDLTARLFALHRQLPGESSFPDPWTFPAIHDGLVGTLATTFTVVPEPSSLVLAMAGALLLFRRSR